MKYLLPFKNISKEDVGLVGGKGANLGEMTQAGFPVPPGYVVSSQAYFEFLKGTGLASRIHALLGQLNVEDTKKLDEASRLIQKAIIKTQIPKEIETEIKKAYLELGGGKNILVAIRSSSTGEDVGDATAAGQQTTFLNVQGEKEVLNKVREVWASLFNARAIFYRKNKKLNLEKSGIAVPIQLMVDSTVSGVSFSLDPISNDKSKIIVESVYGLGEMIVQGAVTPDHFEFDKKTLEVTYYQLGLQDKQMIRVRGGNKIIDVSPAHGAKQKVSEKVLREVAKYTRDLEQHYLRPQDSEWAYDGHKLYIVQTRPVTTAGTVVAAPTSINLPIVLRGAPGSPGIASGKVIVIHSAKEISQVEKGDILVTEMTTPDFVPAMKRAVAIVTDKGGRTAHAAIVSRELGIPAIVGTEQATKLLKTGSVYTVNGTLGLVHAGAYSKGKVTLPYEPVKRVPIVIRHPKTATKVMVNLAEPELAQSVASFNVDGVGLLRAEFMIAQIGVHPRYAIKEGLTRAYIAKLTDGLVTFCRAFGDRPVIYRATDFKSNEYKNLKGGAEFEMAEDNPMLGYRGAFRYIKEPDEFALELEAIKKVRNVHNLKNLHLMIPFVRSPKELAAVKQLITAAGLHRSTTFKLYMMAEIPTNIIQLEKFAEVGIDGISVGSNDLTQLTLGVDRDSSKVAEEFNELDEAVLWSLEKLGREGRKLGLSVGICGQAPSVYPELCQKLVEWGYSYISVSPDVIGSVRDIVASAESKISKKAK